MRLKLNTTRLNENPIFIKFLNWKRDTFTIEGILKLLEESFTDTVSKEIVRERLLSITEDFLNNAEIFQKYFQEYMDSLITTKTVSEEFLLFLNNAYKYIEDSVTKNINDIEHCATIKNKDGRWFEALMCYNFILTFNYFGSSIIKRCPLCQDYFCHKGKYAKYCSDGCKTKGISSD